MVLAKEVVGIFFAFLFFVGREGTSLVESKAESPIGRSTKSRSKNWEHVPKKPSEVPILE